MLSTRCLRLFLREFCIIFTSIAQRMRNLYDVLWRSIGSMLSTIPSSICRLIGRRLRWERSNRLSSKAGSRWKNRGRNISMRMPLFALCQVWQCWTAKNCWCSPMSRKRCGTASSRRSETSSLSFSHFTSSKSIFGIFCLSISTMATNASSLELFFQHSMSMILRET